MKPEQLKGWVNTTKLTINFETMTMPSSQTIKSCYRYCIEIPKQEESDNFEESDFEIGKRYRCFKYVGNDGTFMRFEVHLDMKKPRAVLSRYEKYFVTTETYKLIKIKERLKLNKKNG